MSVLATHFSPVPTALLRDPAISPPAKALYAVIRSYAHFGHCEGAYPAQATLATALGASVNTLVRWRAELAAAGWLQWTLTRAPGGAVERTDYVCRDTPWGDVPPPMGGEVTQFIEEEGGGVPTPVEGGSPQVGG